MTHLATLALQDGVSILTLDDGKVNPFSFDMIEAIEEHLDNVPTDHGALLIAGRRGVLSAGFDLNVVRGGSNERLLQLVERGVTLLLRVAQFPRPVIVECSGHAVALGAFLLLVADWRIGVRGDFRIGLNEVKNGLPMPSCFRAIARNRIAPNWFDRAYLHAELYSPAEAVAPGFLDQVEAPESLRSAAFEQAKRLSDLPSPAYSVAKELDRRPFAESVMNDFHADARQAFAATLPETPLENSPAA